MTHGRATLCPEHHWNAVCWFAVGSTWSKRERNRGLCSSALLPAEKVASSCMMYESIRYATRGNDILGPVVMNDDHGFPNNVAALSLENEECVRTFVHSRSTRILLGIGRWWLWLWLLLLLWL
jgi:hypothetical protein